MVFQKIRWDSSDPDRAPPPLPLNPGTSSPVTKNKTSATISAAAEALTAKARESAYTINPMPSKSPDKSLIKGQYHKRLQSLQNTNGNLSNYLDSVRSPEKSPERSPERSPDRLSRLSAYDFENRSPDRSPTRSGTPTPSSKDLGKESLSLRSGGRPPPKAILGENGPTSATMLALQNTPSPRDMDPVLSNITNGSSALVRTPHSFDAISSQILSLTSIATNLQREMTQLSRRSKDNATDLISLKEATNARDEDIRKSLRELVTNLSCRLLDPSSDHESRNGSHYIRGPGSYLLDNKPHASPPGVPKSVSLPRIPSPASFAATLEREITSGPSPFSVDGAANIALLEKVLREMATKEGQERLLFSLSEIKDKSTATESDPLVGKRLEEIITLLNEKFESRALVSQRDNGSGAGNKTPKVNLNLDNSNPMPLARNTRDMAPYGESQISVEGEGQPFQSSRASDFISDDMLKLLRRMKDSITEGGGLSAEIKALVRELRGEVLGMGREIGRKLDQAESTRNHSNVRDDAHGPGREEIAHIVEQGLAELREHMDRVMHERRRQSSSSSISRSTVDSQEVYHAVKAALNEMPLNNQIAVQQPGTGIEREEILEAVREAWETYKPEIELQNFGLERDEILQCLKEGLQEYQPQNESKELGGASYEEVMDAVREGLKHFKPPAPVETEASITREEILMTMRECLESFDFPAPKAEPPRESEITREDVLDAVKEGLSTQGPIIREVEVNRDDLFDAIKAGLEGVPTPMAGVGEQVLEKMQDLIDEMRGEFKQYSSANGHDTEQVLDAIKDGLEVLRAGIETYVDRAADVTGKDEIIETVRDGLEHLRMDLEGTIADAPRCPEQTNSGELLDAMEKEFEHLRQTIATSMLRNGGSAADKEEVLDAIRDGFEEVKGKTASRDVDSSVSLDTIHAMKEEFEHLRETMATSMIRGGAMIDNEEIVETIRQGLEGIRIDVERSHDRPESILSNTGELLDGFNEGLDSLRVDIEKMVNKPLDMTVNYEILDTLKDGLAGVRADIDRLHASQTEQETVLERRGGEVVIADSDNIRRNDIENLEILITQLRIKVEALDNMPSPPPPPPTESAARSNEGMVGKEDLENLESMIRAVHASVISLADRERSENENAVTKDDTDAIETLLRNTKARLDDLARPEAEGMARVEQLDTLESIVQGSREAIEDLAARFESDTASKTDIGMLEGLLKDTITGIEELRENIRVGSTTDSITKSDLEALETICMDSKIQIEELKIPDADTLPTKVDVECLGGLISEFKERMEGEADLTAQAFEARKIEHGGIADKIEDVKVFLGDIREELKSKVDFHGQGIESLAKTLETMSEAMAASDAAVTVKELMDIVNREFERSHGNHEDLKLEMEQNHATLYEKYGEHKNAIVNDLNAKIDARFDEIMLKHDDAQIATEAKASAFKEQNFQQTDTLNSTRAVAEDLKLLIDTLGITVTESCDRMGQDSKTVFNRVDDIGIKLDESMQTLSKDDKVSHQLTRAEISKALVAVEGVQAHASEYHPKILDAISHILSILGQQFEQAQRSTEEIKTSVNALPSAISASAPPPTLTLPPVERDIPSFEKYDDTEVHAKLDGLAEHLAEAGRTNAQLELLGQIKSQVTASALDFNAFVTTQQATIVEAQHSCAQEAEEAAIALEKRLTQKESVEADIARLSGERSSLSNSVSMLKRNHDELISQKSRLQADLSSLETALQIRKEEMHLMETRAESLEKKILEGVLDHSRSLLLTSRPQSSLKAMNLKRVPSAASTITSVTRSTSIGTTVPTTVGSAVSAGVGIALKRRQPQRSNAGGPTSNTKGDRRILSLSTISANRGNTAERSMVVANSSFGSAGMGKPNAAFGAGGLKRSHSVKSNFPARKTSWGGTKQGGFYADDLDEDKENSVLDEVDEEGSERGTERRTSYGTETERRTSYTGTYSGTGSYGTGSVVEGEDDRRTSLAASTVGTVGQREAEDDEDEDADADEDQESLSGDSDDSLKESEHEDRLLELYNGDETSRGNAQEVVIYGPPSDSGIGTDMPTAALDGRSDYFKLE